MTQAFEWVERQDESVEAIVRWPNLSREVRILAENVRDQSTGVHAHVSIAYGDPQNGRFDMLEDDTFNLGRMKDRNPLAKVVAESIRDHHNRDVVAKERQLPDLRSDPGKVFQSAVRTWLRDFCSDAWKQYVGHFRSEWRTGTLEPRPPRWLMNPWALLDASMILFGREGGGKSTVMYIWALMVQYGIETVFGQPTERMPVLWVNLERPVDQVDDLMGNIAGAMGLERNTGLERIDARGHGLREVAPAIKEFVDRHERRCVVAVDTVSRAVSGDLIDNAVANAFANQMNAFGCPWWATAHMAKDPEKKRKEDTIFGAGAFAWAADLTIKLSFEDKGLFQKIITLQTGKVNNAPRSGRRSFVLDFEEDRGLVAFDRLSKDQAGDVGKSPDEALVDRIFKHLTTQGRCTIQAISMAVQRTDRQCRDVMRKDSRFAKTSSRPVLFYIPERRVVGSRKLEKQTSMSTSDSPTTSSNAEHVGVGGNPLKGVSTPVLPTNVSDRDEQMEAEDGTDQPLPTSDLAETCWHCSEKCVPARFDGPEGRPVCQACADEVDQEDGPMADD